MTLREAAIAVIFTVSASPAPGQAFSDSKRLTCFGNEPSRSIALESPGQARVTVPNAPLATYRGRETRNEPLREGVWRGNVKAGGGDLVLLMSEAARRDGTSDTTRPVIARVSLANGAFLTGCCRIPGTQA